MLNPQVVRAFVQELTKISAQIATPTGIAEVDSAIRIIRTLPDDADKLISHLTREVRKTKLTPAMGGYANIAIPKHELSTERLKELGFKATRLRLRYPGESLRALSFRKGRLHVHDYPGPVYLMHEDKYAPKGLKQTVRHLISDGIPSLGAYDKSLEARPVKA